MVIKIEENDALIIVDMQKCFCLGGALPVNDGDQIVPVLNEYIVKFRRARAQIFATRDWHPPNHRSFKNYGGRWPPHCIQNTRGADFHPNLKLPVDTTVISTGESPFVEGYSGFDHTDIAHRLKANKIKRVFVGGLATDYCVKYTVLDALEKGFETILLVDAMKGINEKPDDAKKAIDKMLRNGAKTITLNELE